MNDLIEKFFYSELTEAESDALEKQLDSSEDIAGRFAEIAEERYRSFGLPDPAIPPWWMRFIKTKLWFLLPLVFLLGWLAVWYFPARGSYSSVPLKVEKTGSAQTDPGQNATAIQSAAEMPVKEAKGKAPIIQDVKTLVLTTALENTGQADPVVNVAKDYRNIQIVVNMQEDQPVTVRILGPGNTEVRSLFTGRLQAGRWSFRWNGLLMDGRQAVPGRYLIEVLRGAGRQTQEVIVK